MDDIVGHRTAISPKGDKQHSYLDLLGRVKKALQSAQEVSVSATDIRPYPDQPREYFDEAHIVGLSKSIDAGGQTTRGMIRKKAGKTPFELIDGECRWRGILRIPESRRPLYKADLIDADDEVVQFLIAGVSNFNRRGHTPIEIMKTIDRMMGFKIPMEEVANLLGISKFWADQMHGLRKLDPRVQKMLNPALPKGQVLPVTAAIQISKIEPKFQLALAQRVLSRDISLARLRGEVVKVAEKEGSRLRVRDVPADQQWNSLGKKVDVLSRTAGDVKAVLRKGQINRFITGRPKETTALLAKILKTKELLGEIEGLIREARK